MLSGWFHRPARRPYRHPRRFVPAHLRVEGLESRLTPANPMPPDLHVLGSYLSGWTVNNLPNNGREIRFSTGLANGGIGAFELRGTTTIINNPDGTQNQVVNQRVYQDDGSFVDRVAGMFTYHPGHGHVHFDDMAWGQLRVRTPGNGLGDVVAIGPKTSFCLIDINRYNSSLPGSPPSPGVYQTCGASVQGISVGWNDVYGSTLDGQAINVTGIPNGDYWLEVVCDPLNHILETNETNNTTRIAITLSNLPATGFRVLTGTPFGASPTPVGAVEVTFNEPVDAATFTAADVAFSGPGGTIPVTVTPVSSLKFRVEFATQSAVGFYGITIGPNIASATGRLMDQNNNGTGGEPADAFFSNFTIPAPRVLAASPAGAVSPPVSSVRITYTKAMDSASFTTADLASFTGPGGVNLLPQVTGIAPVTAGGFSAAFDITFAAQTTIGTYSLVLEPSVLDMSGNPVDQNGDGQSNASDRFTASFTAVPPGTVGPDAAGYDAITVTPLAIDLVGQKGAFALNFDEQDDGFAVLNLGSNQFNFYGQTYTGNQQLFVSTNGLITFGQANDAYENNDLSGTTLPTIAVLWDDWVRGPGNPHALAKFEDADGDGTTDRLVIQWNRVWHYSSSPSDVTFQALLQLNTGPTPGAILLNYPDLLTEDNFTNGVSATVGTRAGGATGARLLVSHDGTSSMVGNNKAIRIGVPTVASITRMNPNPAPAGDLEFLVTFSHAVTGVDVADFTLTTTGNVTGARVDHIHATADPRVYEVHVETGVGSGTVRLNVADDDTITSPIGVKLGGVGVGNGVFNRGQIYTVTQPPPRVLGSTIGDGTSQRSRITELRVVFDRVVAFAGGNPIAAFQLMGPSGLVNVAVDLSASTPTSTVARLTFSGTGTEFGSLADGLYTLTVLASQVSTGGVTMDPGDYSLPFHRRFGDTDGDRDVDLSDLIRFGTAYQTPGNYGAGFDFDGDGDVDLSDLINFGSRYQVPFP